MRTKEEYQEALDCLHDYAEDGKPINFLIGVQEKDALQELIDLYPEYLELKKRDTPMKPKTEKPNIHCTNCNNLVGRNGERAKEIIHFCPNCGQKLDWSDEE